MRVQNPKCAYREKEGDLTHYFMPTENSKTNGQHKTPPKTSITQRSRTDFGRSVGVTQSSGVVKPGLMGTSLPTHRKGSVINRAWQEIII